VAGEARGLDETLADGCEALSDPPPRANSAAVARAFYKARTERAARPDLAQFG
jgi:hypothetical protein